MDIEKTIATVYVTEDVVSRARTAAKMEVLAKRGASGVITENLEATYKDEIIPALLQEVFTRIVLVYLMQALQEHGDVVIDFKKLRKHVNTQTKGFASDLF